MRTHARFTHEYLKFGFTVLAIAAIVTVFFLFVNVAVAAEPATQPQQSVVSDLEIQAAIDGKIDQTAADRQAIQTLLQRDDVRQMAGTAGLNLERASAAAALLSGPSLEMMAARVRVANASGTVGGNGNVVVTTTGIIIILLVLILLTN